jgi:hypothetical protein
VTSVRLTGFTLKSTFQAIGDTPSAGHWNGTEGMANAWREWLDAWQEFQVEAEDSNRNPTR